MTCINITHNNNHNYVDKFITSTLRDKRTGQNDVNFYVFLFPTTIKYTTIVASSLCDSRAYLLLKAKSIMPQTKYSETLILANTSRLQFSLQKVRIFVFEFSIFSV
jgi:hypothetical protein